MNITLVIMAAGIGSRFGGGIKQLEPVGRNGEIIMDYSIHDAIAAGFQKIVFVIRRDIERDFRECIGNRIEQVCGRLDVEVGYAYQSLDDLPAGVAATADRKKPWGTGQAIWACRDIVREPFAAINADDYYGRSGFRKLHDFLCEYAPEAPNRYCMIGFRLKNTLSDHGAVTRGVCRTDGHGYLTGILETGNIVRNENGIFAGESELDADGLVSMNMWGLTPEFLPRLEAGFCDFLSRADTDVSRDEFLLPMFIDSLLQREQASIRVLDTPDKWVGVTYRADKPVVVNAFAALIDGGVYRANLYEDLFEQTL